MKRPLQLPLAIALALGGTNALALGLGPVHVKSRLNEPLNAEIPVIQGSAGEAEGLLVNLAAAEDFERVGIRSRPGIPLEFSVIKGANGDPVIKVTSTEPVRVTYLDFLIEANWPKGRLLREYTLLLDPPVTAPVRSAVAEAAPASAREPATTQPLRESRGSPVAAAPRAGKPAPAPKAEKAGSDEYGPVAAGETLSAVARATRPDANVNQTMLALLKHNPNAFYKDNINALKRGAILRVPSTDEIKAIGSVAEAAAQVQAQVEDWRGGRATPTRVADTGADQPAAASPAKAPKASAGNSRDGGEHLALVPPKAGRDSLAMADRPGAGAGSPAASSELKAELARAKEALTSKDQEAGELKSRVKELEALTTKNDRLLSLKDSEIAELQQKLRELQAKSAAPATPDKAAATAVPAAAPVAATATPPKADAKIDKRDIWGDAGAAAPKATEAKSGETKPPGETKPNEAKSEEAKPEAKPAEATTEAKPADGGSAEPKPGDAAPQSSAAPAAATTTTTPLPATPATTTVAPKKPAAKAAPAGAWYDAPWVLPGALGGGVLLLALGALGLRKRKQAQPTRESIATAFGDSPLGAAAEGSFAAEEAKLREQLRDDPSNIGLYLELLSLYYAERDVVRFEEAAREMHAHVVDPYQPEWLEAQAMGQELAPHNPLFAGAAGSGDEADGPDPYAETAQHAAFEQDEDLDLMQPPAAPVAGRADEVTFDFGVSAPAEMDHASLAEATTFDFGAPDAAASSAVSEVAFDAEATTFGFGTPTAPAAASGAADTLDEPFSFDDLPPLEFDLPVAAAAAAAPTASAPAHDLAGVATAVDVPAPSTPAVRDDDIFAGEDAVATKLDLARAYMDMGDPEGARSMLEEVLVEGNDTQKGEAQRLMAELR
jgi:pilus assembly protein FimV